MKRAKREKRVNERTRGATLLVEPEKNVKVSQKESFPILLNIFRLNGHN